MEKLIFDLQRFAEGPESQDEAQGAADTTDTSANQEGSDSFIGKGTQTALGGDGESTTPQVPESYDFTAVLKETGLEADEKSTEEFTNLLKGMGATQEQAAGMATYGIKYAQGVAEAVAKNLQEQYVNEVKSWGDAAKEELGGVYQETLGKAAIARDYIEQKIPGFTQMLNLTGAGNHIAMIKTMAAFADLISEDPGKMGGAGTAATSTDMYPHTDFSKY
nr:MAG TPA: putative protease [Caudoviricetes sp.]